MKLSGSEAISSHLSGPIDPEAMSELVDLEMM